jgi:dTDP-4-amino-4,6-dideoxygalactose transaminase/predicted dehydrogenase
MTSLVKRGLRKVKRIAIRESAVFRAPLRAAVIGYGGIAPDHAFGYETTGQALLVAVSDIAPKAIAAALDQRPYLRAYRDYRQMLEEVRPDVVSICTWPQHHAEAVESAAAAGVKGILCEKPVALQLADIERMRVACAGRGIKLAGGHQYRFDPAYAAARAVVASGELGIIAKVTGFIKSSLANNGPHLIDTVRCLLGDPPAREVTCNCRRERKGFNRGTPAEDEAQGHVEFGDGIRVELTTGDLAPAFFGIVIEGSRGKLEVDRGGLRVNGVLRAVSSEEVYRKRQFGQFVRWVKGQLATYPADFEPSKQAVELILALYESARLGAPVVLPLRNEGDVIGQLYPEATPDPARSEAGTDGLPAPAASFSLGPDQRPAMDGGRRAVARWFRGGPTLGPPELINLTRVIVSRNLSCTEGRMVPALEGAFCRHYGSPHAVASTSGTAAIHVALGALSLEPGDEVITTPMTDMGTVIPILASNCLPIFADIDPVTGCLTAEGIARKITPRTRAVILVHLFGRPADLTGITELLRERGISLIEDCAQAHDAEYQGRKVGTFGDFGCFSLQQSKQITCGDGGVTLVNREDLAERAALFVDKGWDRKRGARAHLFLGMNYRMTELQGAVALAQLRRLPGMTRARRARADRLTHLLRDVPGVLPPPEVEGVVPSWWMYAFRISEETLGLRPDVFAEIMMAEGVPLRRSYLPAPIFEFDVIKHQRTYGRSGYPFSAYPYEPPDPEDFPGYGEFVQRLLFMPWSQHVGEAHVDGIAAATRKVAALAQHARTRRSGSGRDALVAAAR